MLIRCLYFSQCPVPSFIFVPASIIFPLLSLFTESTPQEMGSYPQETAPSKDLILSHATTNDAPELAEVYMSAFEHPPLRRTMYKGVPRSAMVKRQEASFAKVIEAQQNPSPTQETHFLKVADPDTYEIMALVIWIYLPQGYDAEEDVQKINSNIPDGANERLWRDFGVKTGELRSEHPGRHEGHWRKYYRSFFILCLRM